MGKGRRVKWFPPKVAWFPSSIKILSTIFIQRAPNLLRVLKKVEILLTWNCDTRIIQIRRLLPSLTTCLLGLPNAADLLIRAFWLLLLLLLICGGNSDLTTCLLGLPKPADSLIPAFWLLLLICGSSFLSFTRVNLLEIRLTSCGVLNCFIIIMLESAVVSLDQLGILAASGEVDALVSQPSACSSSFPLRPCLLMPTFSVPNDSHELQ